MKSKINDEVKSNPKTNPLPRIPEGEYEAVCIRAEKSRYLKDDKRLYLHFQIINGEYEGTRLYEVFNINYKSFPKGCKYYTDWSISNGGLPSRRDKMSSRIFLQKVFMIKVRDATPKYSDGTPKPMMFHYSVVDRITERITE